MLNCAYCVLGILQDCVGRRVHSLTAIDGGVGGRAVIVPASWDALDVDDGDVGETMTVGGGIDLSLISKYPECFLRLWSLYK